MLLNEVKIPDNSVIEYFSYIVPEKSISFVDNKLFINDKRLSWIGRFPFLKYNIIIKYNDAPVKFLFQEDKFQIELDNSSRNNTNKNSIVINIPLLRCNKLKKELAILPIDIGKEMLFPQGLNDELPDYMYSSLAVILPNDVYFFDYDYISSEHFWKYFKKNIDCENKEKLPHFLWGIKILAEELPDPIGFSRETSYHLGYNDGRLPRYMNLSLTNICNLRCTICPTHNPNCKQDIHPTMMNPILFNYISDILFPFCEVIELNSYGEPTLYTNFPDVIKHINKHGCRYKIQTNGMNMSESIMSAIISGIGEVNFSIDAIGILLEQQRLNSKWSEIEKNILTLLQKRDKERIKVAIYPAVTQKTINGIVDLCKWANNIGIDMVTIRYYQDFPNGIEKTPSQEQKIKLKEKLYYYIQNDKPDIIIQLDQENLNGNLSTFYSWETDYCKYSSVRSCNLQPNNKSKYGLNSKYICAAPFLITNIDFDGNVCCCCKLHKHDEPLNYNSDGFFINWFGINMSELRNSLRHSHSNSIRWNECIKCIQEYVK